MENVCLDSITTYNIFGKRYDEKQYDSMITFSVIIIVILFLFMVILSVIFFVYSANGGAKAPQAPQITRLSPYDSKIGSVNRPYYENGVGYTTISECGDAENSVWNHAKSRCDCSSGYYGMYCDQQIYNSEYHKIDTDIDKLSYTYYDKYNVKSFEDCQALSQSGFIYDNEELVCRLITSDVVASPQTRIIASQDGNLYVKNRIIIKTKVFAFKGKIPIGYFYDRPDSTKKESYQFYTITVNKSKKVSYLPTTIVNDGSLIGIWSLNYFTEKDFDKLLESNNSNTYVDFGLNVKYSVVFPQTFYDASTIYVMYKDKKDTYYTSFNVEDTNAIYSTKYKPIKPKPNIFDVHM